ncbi:hypothetical protein EUX98_g600 [Antrodiella citrinella]|uniref:Uncharacterized protein n=1 Tax=Antrodiella citrinella TaxID=2447956 RepID=A0A4S4N3P8_9APHY|nr:hypothetical protein EUX98_g600 [Antrodiella citrinella]
MENKGKQRAQDVGHRAGAGDHEASWEEEDSEVPLTFTPEEGTHRTGFYSTSSSVAATKTTPPASPPPSRSSMTATDLDRDGTADTYPDKAYDDNDDVADAHSFRSMPIQGRRSDPTPSDRDSLLRDGQRAAPSASTTPVPYYDTPGESVPASVLPTMPQPPFDSAHLNTGSALTPDHILPLLACPICDPSALLTSPVTLRCGHTICMSHLTDTPQEQGSSSFVSSFLASIASSSKRKLPLPQCPIPTCHSLAPANTNATVEQLPRHPQSDVNYLPPPSVSLPPLDNPSDEAPMPLREDVTVNKIMNLAVLSRAWFFEQPSRSAHYDDDRTDSEPEGRSGAAEEEADSDTPDPDQYPNLDRPPFASVPDRLPNGASRRRRSDSPSPSRRPHKRPRRARPQRERRDVHSRQPPLSPSARFEKELYAELTCHICFGLTWQPVTTPCQHVRC